MQKGKLWKAVVVSVLTTGLLPLSDRNAVGQESHAQNVDSKPSVQRNDDAVLSTKVKRLRVNNVTLPECVLLLGSRIKFQYAIEAIPSRGTQVEKLQGTFSIDVKDTTLRQVFDLLIARAPVFTWRREADGMIRFLPTASTSDNAYLLSRMLPEYKVAGTDYTGAVLELFEELSKLSPDFKPAPLKYIRSEDALGDPILLNIVRHNVTGREILDLLSAKQGYSWMLSYDSARRTYTLGIGSKAALPVKLLDPTTARDLGVTIKPAEATLLEVDGETPRSRSRNIIRPHDAGLWERQIEHFSVKDVTVPECVMLLANRLKFQYAVEAVPFGSATANKLLSRISVDVKELPLVDVFDAITAQNRAYGWTLENGLVRFVTQTSRTDKSYLLIQPMPQFSIVGKELPTAIDTFTSEFQKLAPTVKVLNKVTDAPRDVFGEPILIHYVRRAPTARKVLDDLSFKFNMSWMILPDAESLTVQMAKEFTPPQQVADTAKIELSK